MTCNREHATHHNACDCREAHFAALQADRDALAERIEALEGALKPFARAEHIIATVDGDRIRCILTYPADATETFCLADLDAARKALGEG